MIQIDFDILDSIPDAVMVIDENGMVLFWNKESEKLYGFKKADVLGNTISEFGFFAPSSFNEQLSSKPGLSSFLDLDKALVQNSKGQVFTVRFKTKEVHTDNGESLYIAISHDISNYVDLENELKLNEQRYRKIIENNYDGIIIHERRGGLKYVSPSMESLSGYSRLSLLGKSALDLVHPDDLNEVKTLTNNVLVGKKKSVQIRTRIKKSNDQYMWVMATISDEIATPGIDGIVANIKDIDIEQRVNIELKRSEEKFRKLFDNSFIGIAMIDIKSAAILDFNQSLLNVLGYTRSELEKLTIKDITPKEYWKADKEQIKQLLIKGHYGPYQKQFIRKDQERIEVILSGFQAALSSGKNVSWNHILDISQIEKTHRALEAAEERFKNYIENASDTFVILNDQAIYSYVSPSIKGLLGYEPEEVLGTHNLDLMHPEDIELVQKAFDKALANLGSNQQSSFRVLHKNGNWVWVEANGRFIKNEEGKLQAYLLVRNKNPHQKDLEEHLRKLALVAEKTNSGVIITDAKERIEWVNDSFLKLSGYEREAIIGKTSKQIVRSKEEIFDFLKVSEVVHKGAPFSGEICVTGEKGAKRWIEILVTPIKDSAGKITNFIAIENDISKRKQIEIDFEKTTLNIKEQNKWLKNFTYMLAHDFRSYGSNIYGLSEGIKLVGDSDPDSLKQFAEALSKSSLSFINSLENLKQMLKQVDKGNLPLENLNFNEHLNKVIELLKGDLDDAKAIVKNHVPDSIAIFFFRSYLESLLINLISNAIRYKDEKRNLELNIESEEKEKFLQITISDNGIGIDVEKYGEAIFEEGQSVNNNTDGLGLGLYLVKNQLNSLGGDIRVNSKVGLGTSFTITFLK